MLVKWIAIQIWKLEWQQAIKVFSSKQKKLIKNNKIWVYLLKRHLEYFFRSQINQDVLSALKMCRRPLAFLLFTENAFLMDPVL